MKYKKKKKECNGMKYISVKGMFGRVSCYG